MNVKSFGILFNMINFDKIIADNLKYCSTFLALASGYSKNELLEMAGYFDMYDFTKFSEEIISKILIIENDEKLSDLEVEIELTNLFKLLNIEVTFIN